MIQSQVEIMPNKNLKLKVTKEEQEELKDWDINDDERGLRDLLEHKWTNGSYYVINGDDLGHMTSAPMIVEDLDYYVNDEHPYHEEHGRVWWFPNYMIQNPIEILRDEGEVEFTYGYNADEQEKEGE